MKDHASAPIRRRAPTDNINLAILLACAFGLLVPFMDSVVKYLGATMVVPEIALARFAVQAVMIGGAAVIFAPAWAARPAPVWPLAARGVCICLGTSLLYAAFAAMPLVEAVAIYFLQPLLLTGLSAVLLKERVGWRRWTAVAVGFVGALFIIGPSFERIGWVAVLPALAAVFFASAALLTRRWASAGSMPMFLLFTAVTATILLSLVMLAGWWTGTEALIPRWPEAWEWGLMLVIGVGTTGTTMMLTQAFRISPTSIVAPFLYIELVGAAIVGYLLFKDVPGPSTIIGAMLVVGAGLFVWWRESKL